MLPRTCRGSWSVWLGITSTVLVLSSCGVSVGSQSQKSSISNSSPTSAGSPVASLTAAAPMGFTSEATDKESGGPTGSIAINEAASADCDAGQLRQDHWVASELRYFDNDPAYPSTYLLLCVTQLSSSANAAANQMQVLTNIEHPSPGTRFPPPTPFGALGSWSRR